MPPYSTGPLRPEVVLNRPRWMIGLSDDPLPIPNRKPRVYIYTAETHPLVPDRTNGTIYIIPLQLSDHEMHQTYWKVPRLPGAFQYVVGTRLNISLSEVSEKDDPAVQWQTESRTTT